MSALFHHAPVLENEDHIDAANGGEPVCIE
jgi:hypothetical protein